MSAAKDRVKDFLKKTRDDPDYYFKLRGSEADAQKFIQRMRVELSRFRGYVKKKNLPLKYFKMIFIDIQQDKDDDSVVIIHLQKQSDLPDLQDEIAEVMGDIALPTREHLLP